MRTATILMLLAFAACSRAGGGEKPSVVYYVAAPASSIALEVQGHSAQRDMLKSGKDVRSIVRTTEPVLTVPTREIVEARAHEIPDPAHDSRRTWAARGRSGRSARFKSFRTERSSEIDSTSSTSVLRRSSGQRTHARW